MSQLEKQEKKLQDSLIFTQSDLSQFPDRTVAREIVVQEITKKMLQRQFLEYRTTRSLGNELPRDET